MGFGALLCGAKLLDYQVFNADEYRQQADYRRLSHQTLFAKRGTVYDRNGNVLASSVECQNVYVNPQLIESKRKAVNALVDILGVDAAEVRDILDRDTTFAYVKCQVDQEDADLLAEKDIAGL
mgnify:CR=1 FL=1